MKMSVSLLRDYVSRHPSVMSFTGGGACRLNHEGAELDQEKLAPFIKEMQRS